MFHIKVSEKIKTHILCSKTFFGKRAIYEIMWKNTVQPDRPLITMYRMHITCWIPKATNTHSECVIPIAFPLQQWWHESASMLRYPYNACLVLTISKVGLSASFKCTPTNTDASANEDLKKMPTHAVYSFILPPIGSIKMVDSSTQIYIHSKTTKLETMTFEVPLTAFR